MLLGNGGAGKSTALLKFALDACEVSLVDPRAPLPVYVTLNALTPAVSLLELIRTQLARHGLQIPAHGFETALREGRFLLLLDGVNEIPTASREQHRDRDLATFLQAHPRARAVLTTRREGYDSHLYKLPTVELEPLDLDGVVAFLHLYLAPHEADALFRHLGGDRADEWGRRGSLANLARTPLYLWMLMETYVANRGELPKNRGQLFHRFVTFILKERETLKGSRIDAESRRLLLGTLALDGLRQGAFVTIPRRLAEQSLSESITSLRSRHLLGHVEGVTQIMDEMRKRVFGFVWAGDHHLQWEHQVFQEYFAATELLANPEIDLESLIRCEHDSAGRRWQGTLQIAAALATTESGASMVCAVGRVDPLLAGHMTIALDPDAQRRVAQDVLAALHSVALTDVDDVRKAEAATLIGEVGGESATNLLLEIAYGGVVAGVKNVACRWLVRLDPDRAHRHSLGQLENGSRAARIQSVILLALLTESRAIDCSWLRTALSDQNHRVNCMALREVSNHRLASAVPAVLEALGAHRMPYVRREAARALGVLLAPEGLSVLNEVAMSDGDPRVRIQCVDSLCRYGTRAEMALACLAHQASDPQVRERAKRIASRIAHQ